MKTSLFLTVLFSLSAYAADKSGNGAGNGGVAIVCRDANNKIVGHPKLLDAYNYEIIDGYTYENQDLTEKEVYDRVKQRLIKVKNYAFLNEFKNEWAIVNDNWKLLPKGVPVAPANDAKLIIGAKDGCKPEYVVNYSILNGRIHVLVNNDILSTMLPFMQSALKVHEAVYALLRKHYQDQTSERAQEITAILTADTLGQKNLSRLYEMTTLRISDFLEKTQNTKGLSFKGEDRFQNLLADGVRLIAKKDLSNRYTKELRLYYENKKICDSKKLPFKMRTQSMQRSLTSRRPSFLSKKATLFRSII